MNRSVTNIPSGEEQGTIIPCPIEPQTTKVNVKPLHAGFVASVDTPSLDRQLDEETLNAIRHAWRQHPVLIFPGQDLDPTGLATFSKQLGEFGDDPYVRASKFHENIIEVRREAKETAPIFGHSWHSDWSFQAEPPSATLLQSHVLPPFGGDTVFASGYKAYEALSSAMQEMLLPLKAIHSARSAYGPKGLFAKDDDTRSMKIIVSKDAEETCLHPLIRTHPESGKRALYINHVYTVGIDGFKESESSAMLNYLFRHMAQPAFIYRHKWRENALLMWDNRCVIHYADGGYTGHQRIMYRATLAGERPVLR
ncbi:MAG: TauD/TfdA family dioxygenase [Pseudomonadota bacterium]